MEQSRPLRFPSSEADREARDETIFAERAKQDATVSLSLHLGFAMLLYIIIVFTFPIDDLSSTHKSLLRLMYNDVTYTRSNGQFGSLRTIEDLGDVVSYSESLIAHLLSDASEPRGRHLHGQYALLGAHKLVSSVALVQHRVTQRNCSEPGESPDCSEDGSGQRLNFGKQLLRNGLEVPYSVGLGGFAVELPLHQKQALDIFQELKDGKYWDANTRDISLLFGLHNAPGQYLGHVHVDFALLPSGRLSRERVDMDFFKLRPYDDPVQGCVLFGLQLWAGLHWIMLLCLLLRRFYLQPHVRWRLALLLEPWTVLELLGHFCVAYSLVVWYNYIQDPRRGSIEATSEHFENILALAAEFQRCILGLSWAVALWTLRMVQFLQELQRRRDRVTAAIVESLFEGVMFFALIVGVMPRVSDFWNALDVLALWFATVSDGREDLVDITGGPAFFLFFVVVCLMVLVNMFTLVVLEAYERMVQESLEHSKSPKSLEQLESGEKPKTKKGRKPLGHRLSNAICDLLHVPVYIEDPLEADEENHDNAPKRFEQLLHEIGWVDARG